MVQKIQVATSCCAETKLDARILVSTICSQDKLSFYHVSQRLDNEIIGETDENDDQVSKLALNILI